MALESALVDRARAIRKQAQPRRIPGRTLTATVVDAWFDARIELPRGSETPATAGGRRRVVRAPTLMYGVEDDDGKEVVLTRNDRVEVDSAELGRVIFEVTGHPQPMRKRQDVIGWEVTIERVEDVELEEDATPLQTVGASLVMPYQVDGVPDTTATGHLGVGQY